MRLSHGEFEPDLCVSKQFRWCMRASPFGPLPREWLWRCLRSGLALQILLTACDSSEKCSAKCAFGCAPNRRQSGGPRGRVFSARNMAAEEAASRKQTGHMTPQEKRARMQEIVGDKDARNPWDNCWKESVTPWDMGQVTPVIQHLVDQGQLPNGRALVPGCGSGYDVLALASASRHVVGLDISERGNSQAKQIAAKDPKGKWVEYIVADFFTYKSEVPFNLIFDYTFFCAIFPALRPHWASKMAELLADDGELITLIYPIQDIEGGPPFAVSVQAYEEVLNPVGLSIVSCEDNELSFEVRKGREKITHWRKNLSKI